MPPDFDIAGVTLASAQAWLRGEVYATRATDLDTSRCEVAFLNELGNRASYRACVAAVLDLWKKGARGAIAHVCSEIYLARTLRQGGLIATTETITWRGHTSLAYRIIIPAPAFAAWVRKMRKGQKTPPTGHESPEMRHQPPRIPY